MISSSGEVDVASWCGNGSCQNGENGKCQEQGQEKRKKKDRWPLVIQLAISVVA